MDFDTLKNILLTPPEDLDWSKHQSSFVRVLNALKNDSLYFVAQVLTKKDREYLWLPNMGKKSLDSLKQVLEDVGVPLGSVVFKDDKTLAGINNRAELETLLTEDFVTFVPTVKKPPVMSVDVSKIAAKCVNEFFPETYWKKLTGAFSEAKKQNLVASPVLIQQVESAMDVIKTSLSENILDWFGDAASKLSEVDSAQEKSRALSSLISKDLFSGLSPDFKKVVMSNLMQDKKVSEQITALTKTIEDGTKTQILNNLNLN